MDRGKLQRLLSLLHPGEKLCEHTAKQLASDLQACIALCETIKDDDAVAKPTPAAAAKKRKRSFDFSRFESRQAAFRLLYVGWKYHGFAAQTTNENTIEGHLFRALERTCLVPLASGTNGRAALHYTRCGRTDVGVSALTQVITLRVRSAAKAGQPLPAAGDELDYPAILNKVLPDDIQITGWQPVDDAFNARFGAVHREYKYFIAGASQLNVPAMQTAAQAFIGTHNFQNFCKMNLENTTNHVRQVMDARVECLPGSAGQALDMLVFYVRGNAFLWHQIRCMVAVLVMVGQNLEEASVIERLLDVQSTRCKPQYQLSSELPLILAGAEYGNALGDFLLSAQAKAALLRRMDALTSESTARTALMLHVRSQLLSAEMGEQAPGQQKSHKPLLCRHTDPPLEERLKNHVRRRGAAGSAGNSLATQDSGSAEE